VVGCAATRALIGSRNSTKTMLELFLQKCRIIMVDTQQTMKALFAILQKDLVNDEDHTHSSNTPFQTPNGNKGNDE
jgi:predicted phage-related endonuclease